MKSFLECKVDRIFAQRSCPLCNSHKTSSFRSAEFIDAELVLPYEPPAPEAKAHIRFFCGAEFLIGADEEIVASKPCMLTMINEANAMEIDANTTYSLQEIAA